MFVIAYAIVFRLWTQWPLLTYAPEESGESGPANAREQVIVLLGLIHGLTATLLLMDFVARIHQQRWKRAVLTLLALLLVWGLQRIVWAAPR